MILAIDIGGTSSKFGLVDAAAREISAYEKFDTREAVGAHGLESFLKERIGHFLEKHPDIRGIGLGFPGLLSKDRRTILELPNIPGADQLPILDRLSEQFPGVPIKIENDANCATLGEHRMGAYRDVNDFLLVTLGTGVGSGLIIDGQLFTGARGNGLELGHILVGREKTLEEQIGLQGFLSYAEARLSNYSQTTRLRSDRLNGKAIYEAAVQGDPLATSLFDYLGTLLGEGLVAAVRLLDVTCILLGGGLSGAFEFIYPGLKKVLESRLPGYYIEDLRIKKASLGNDAGLLGAAGLLLPTS